MTYLSRNGKPLYTFIWAKYIKYSMTNWGSDVNCKRQQYHSSTTNRDIRLNNGYCPICNEGRKKALLVNKDGTIICRNCKKVNTPRVYDKTLVMQKGTRDRYEVIKSLGGKCADCTGIREERKKALQIRQIDGKKWIQCFNCKEILKTYKYESYNFS